MTSEQIVINMESQWTFIGRFLDKEIPLWAAILMVILAILPQLGAWLLKWKHGDRRND